mmetsp:Transcript_4289/g.9244  ORF Transcript_4289/g.9244 Transcript_4289/m.9244 type:complete len:696 (+) Transcript_4289:285-2372(+)
MAADFGDQWMIVLHPSSFSLILSIVFLLGWSCGILVGRKNESALNFSNSTPSLGANQKDCHDGSKTTTNEKFDGPTMVLRGSLRLMSSKWGSSSGKSEKDGRACDRAVVEYLSPEKMNQLLFAKVKNNGSNVSDTFRLDEYAASDDSLQKRSTSQIRDETTNNMRPESFIDLLSLIQKYSVNTSHPYFFNQLFGSLDPIALAAEIVALSVNTSVYTYETAPVFTLLEREVMNQIGKLVFMDDDRDGDCNRFEGEGLMIPGGSLANLTAMHAARHRWKVMNGFNNYSADRGNSKVDFDVLDSEEEKKFEDSFCVTENTVQQLKKLPPRLVAFVSSEAHYSFSKSARVLGMNDEDLIVIPTHPDGRMDVNMLEKNIAMLEDEQDGYGDSNQSIETKRVPFFVACTAGSTVRGSFDEIAEIVKVCRDYESRGLKSGCQYDRSIWVHVDGAWGGSAIFSSRPEVRSDTHMDEIKLADSFTFNPHKMLGAPQQTTAFIVRHRNALRNANAAGAKYLFDPRKNGAEYDLGDLSYTCGRRTDAVKLWAMWKYYGRLGLGARVDQKVDELQLFVDELNRRQSFCLACKPWPFNVNFFYFPPRIRDKLMERGLIPFHDNNRIGNEENWVHRFIEVPEDIAQELAEVSVTLKLRLHEAGEMIIPYQPLTNQKADCFRLVLAGKKNFSVADINHILDTMEKYGADL